MKPRHATINRRRAGRVLAWSALMAITLLISFLLQALAAIAPEPEPAAPPAACQPISPVTAALADGDDVRARFLARLCSGSIDARFNP
jgi:poly-beta-hydroxyalkanoate depolymerase